MKYFVVCPHCGYELMKAENGSYVEVSCPDCNAEIVVEIGNAKITIQQNLSTEMNK